MVYRSHRKVPVANEAPLLDSVKYIALFVLVLVAGWWGVCMVLGRPFEIDILPAGFMRHISRSIGL